MKRTTTVQAGARWSRWVGSLLLVGLVAGLTGSAGAVQPVSNRIACTESALLAAISQANANGGGTITFNCRATTIPMSAGLGTIQDSVVLDGEDRTITMEYTTNFAGCATSDNGIGGPAIGNLRGRNSTIRNLTFKYFLESLQIIGPDNVVERNVFLGHSCSDDAVSTTTVQSRNATIRNNRFQDYRDKAYQMSYGSGTIEGNTFTNTMQPIRGPYDNSQGGVFVIRSNVFTTTGNREGCTGVTIDGTYQIVFERNTLQCFRGLRLGGGTQAIIRDNVIDGNPRQGVLIEDSAVASLSGNTITNNGLSPGTEPAGGVVVWENGQADLGGGALTVVGQALTSRGSNRIQGNGVADVRNLRTGYTVKAEANCWDHQDLASILSQDRAGDVDADPFAAVCGAVGTAPQAPTNFHILR
jgi:parallel beta-helix repeat protein